MRFSITTSCAVGRTRADVRRRLASWRAITGRSDATQSLCGTIAEVVEQVVTGVGVAPDAVTEYVLAAIILLRRRLGESSRRLTVEGADSTSSTWQARLRGLDSRSAAGATLGVVGLGNVGTDVARAACALGMHVLGHDPTVGVPLPGVIMVESLLELCRRSDVVTLHVPLRPATRGMIGSGELDAIGPGGILVNAARGEIVDEPALLRALEGGRLGQAAVDCFAAEPPDPAYVAALAATGRAFLTPHIAGVSDSALATLSERAVDGLIEALIVGSTRSISSDST